MMYRYWLISRPAMPGTVPTRNLERIENFDRRAYDENAGREVWGYVEYSEPLTEKQVSEYELVRESKKTERRLVRDANGFWEAQIRFVPVEDWEQNDGWRTFFTSPVKERAEGFLGREVTA